MNTELSELQVELLKMLEWFDTLCRENNLAYYALGGTMLGAVRHGGFIPWDDDVDVGMPRKDYDKLCKLDVSNYSEKYLIESPESDKGDYCYPYVKIYDKTTTLIENYKKPVIRGIFIDVFPIDCIGMDYKEAMKNFSKIKKQYDFYTARVSSIRKGRAIYKNAAVVLARMLPRILVNDIELRKKISRECSILNIEDNRWGGNLLGNWGKKEIMPMIYYGVPQEYKFENLTIYGVEMYDEYLTYLYGEWKELPPIEKRVSHHDFIKLDLQQSFER